MEGNSKKVNFGPPTIVGPKAEEHQTADAPTQIQLKGGVPLYSLLLEKEPPAIVLPEETQAARDELQELFRLDPTAVRSCQGKTREEALEILREVKRRKQGQE